MGEGEQTSTDRLQTEYTEVGAYIRTAVSVIWDAFKTYFTVVALMFAAFTYLAWGGSRIQGLPRQFGLVVLSLAGIVVTGLAMRAISRVIEYLEALLARGRKVEHLLGARKLGDGSGDAPLFEALQGVWIARSGPKAPAMTNAVLWIFGLAWGYALVVAVLGVDDPKAGDRSVAGDVKR